MRCSAMKRSGTSTHSWIDVNSMADNHLRSVNEEETNANIVRITFLRNSTGILSSLAKVNSMMFQLEHGLKPQKPVLGIVRVV